MGLVNDPLQALRDLESMGQETAGSALQRAGPEAALFTAQKLEPEPRVAALLPGELPRALPEAEGS